MLISEEKKGFAGPRQYSGLTLPEVTVVIDRISEIHAATAAMFISKTGLWPVFQHLQNPLLGKITNLNFPLKEFFHTFIVYSEVLCLKDGTSLIINQF